jgi:hypothetical protein
LLPDFTSPPVRGHPDSAVATAAAARRLPIGLTMGRR